MVTFTPNISSKDLIAVEKNEEQLIRRIKVTEIIEEKESERTESGQKDGKTNLNNNEYQLGSEYNKILQEDSSHETSIVGESKDNASFSCNSCLIY